MKRILLLTTVATIMALKLVAMASAAFAVGPPLGSGTGCAAGQHNATDAIGTGEPSDAATTDAPSEVQNPSNAADAPGTNNSGLDKAEGNTSDSTPC
jgi:hypothetical protein